MSGRSIFREFYNMIKRRSAQTSLKPTTRRRTEKRTASKSLGATQPTSGRPKKRATLAVLVYLCGDCHIEKYTDKYLESLLAAAPSENIHLLIQYDTAEGANRYLVRAGTRGPEKQEVRRDVNTGDQSALEEFLAWGLKTVSAEYHVLVLSGLGINPRYVRQSLRLDTLPEQLQKVRGGKPGDPNEAKYSREFADKVAKLGAEELAKYRDAIQQRTFSICHDFSHSGSLEVKALRDALMNTRQHFDEVKKDNRFELILMHAGATAFVEVLFELEGLARVYVGSSDRLPDNGLPFDRILKNWDKATDEIEKKTDRLPVAQVLAESFLSTIRSTRKPPDSTLDTLIAVNLDTLDEVARVLDALAVALLHSIGDWHVLDALHATVRSIGDHSINVAEPGSKKKPKLSTILDDIEFVPAVDLFLLLTHLEAAFANKLDGATEDQANSEGSQSVVPVAFSQRDRIQKLYKLIRKTLAHLNSKHLLADDSLDGSLLIGDESSTNNKRRKGSKGLNILLPALRTAEQIAEETGKIYSLSTPSYSKLNFSRRVHWSALVGAVLMIHEKPHALWRVISSMLADASSPARDAVLSRLISKQSVVSQLRGQFRSLGDAESLTMSFDFLDSGDRDLANFQVRLEPSLGGSIVYQQTSRVYKSSLNSTWRNLQGLLDDSRPMEGLVTRLRALGASLGEDIIQDMIERLEVERAAILKNGGEAPHLTLQMPREFMRYPWELMSDGKKMLCERYALGRQVFMESNSVRPPTRRASDLIRVLVIGDPAYTNEFKQEIAAKGWALAPLPSARLEARSIERAFGQLNEEMAGVVAFEIKSMIGKTISTDDMRMYLRDGGFDLIHYAGHAFFNKEDPDGSAWVLSDGLLRAREIRNTLARSEQPPWLIFANACEASMEDGRATAQPNDVTGLATACINHGVAAYIAPLWPVDDEIARWLAVGFYRQLLRERYSVGESLRRSRMAIWDRLRESGVTMTMPAKTALTWSSFVLYGDPTSRLLQTLWTPTSAKNKRKATENKSAASSKGNGIVQNRFRSVTAGQLCATIDLPSNLMLSSSDSTSVERGLFGSRSEPNKGIRIELVERDGLRFWRTAPSDSEARTRTFSPLGKILDPQNENEKSRKTRQSISSHIGSERGLMDYVRVVKSWVVSKYNNSAGKSLVTDLAAEFDRQQVPDEQLSRFTSAEEFRRVRPNAAKGKAPRSDDRGDWLDREKCLGQFDRALLVIHGTFSKCSPLIADFQQLMPPDRRHPEEESESLFNWMLRRYRAVLGFDHWTLSKSPAENAQLLLTQLPLSWKTTGRDAPLEIDILCHSRGGLVARALTEKLKPKIKIRRVVMVGVPNAGTGLADPANWGVMADILVNQVSQDPTGLLGRLSSFLFYMLAQGVEQQVPGLQAMRPISGTNRADVNPFLSKLQMPNPKSGTEYFVVASNYVPDRNTLSLQTILNEIGDEAIDRFFAAPNDLVVETASMWALDRKSSWTEKIQSISPENILLFNTLRGGPENLPPELQSGVHHTNYFLNRTVRDFIRKVLER